jgi:MFS family permease
MRGALTQLGRRFGAALTGPLPADVRANIAVEAGTSIAYGIFFAAGIAFLPVVLRRLGAGPDLLALYITLTYVGSITASLSVMALRRWHPLRLTVVCWVAGRAIFLLMAFAADPLLVVVLVTLFWLAESFPAPAYTRLMQEVYPVEYRGRAMSAVRIGMVAAVIVATPIAGVLLDLVGYRVLLPFAGVAGIIGALRFARMQVPAAHSSAAEAPAAAVSVNLPGIMRRNPRFALYLFGLTLFGFGNIIGTPLYPLVQVDRLQLSYATIGYLTLAQSLCWLVGFVAWGRVIDRSGPVRVMTLSAAFAALVPFSYLFAVDPWTLLPAFVAQGIVQAGFDIGVTNIGIHLAEPGRVVEYAALQHMVVGMRGMVAPLLGAGLLGAGLPAPAIFAIGALLLVATCITFWTIRR